MSSENNKMDRKDRLALAFSQTITDVNDTSDLLTAIHSLEKLKSTELKTWWDANSLRTYLERKIIPRGLRIKKIPTSTFSPEFITTWNSILSECSFELIQLIIQHEEIKLTDLEEKIKDLETTVANKYSSHTDYENLCEKMESNLSKLETIIANIKKKKYQRDIIDYSENKVYEWRRANNRPRSILKKRIRNARKSYPNVAFSSTEAESADSNSNSEPSDEETATTSATNKKSAASVPPPPSFLEKKKSLKETEGATALVSRYPKRAKGKNKNK